jgi:thiamine biosynthesis lipoprotein
MADWPIAMQNPFEPERDRAIVRVSDARWATSSIGGRRWRRGDRALHHVIDPRTGTAARSDLYSVAARAPTAVMADVAAKVVLVLGSASGTSSYRWASVEVIALCQLRRVLDGVHARRSPGG